ncbi:major facilitator superfamily domain-containing protein [Chaetomium strumarium]|uniref:Major facilitator superfamily domain-containing protein n=1 Tax=Chaetomium strumarium TaxID=1170767 RepID=A0AAJ0GM36_9PEZI|nr:major facilitator superfamily domain-containing protein [Chaetomium strumarium]
MRSEVGVTTAIELQSSEESPRTSSPERQVEDGHGHEMQSLPPVDRGKDAWLFLAACFMIEALVWGFGYSFGVFQNYYSTHEPFIGASNIPVVGTCALGIMYLDTPLVMGLHRRFPKAARYSTIFGLLIMCLALALSSFSTTVTHLLVTQGILYAIGGSIAYSSCIIYLEEWFVARRGLAFGIMWSATGLAGVVLPLLLEWLLNAQGYQTTLRIFACAVFALTAPLSYFVKPRLPVAPARHAKPFSLRFVVQRPFMLYQAFNVLEAVGFFLPGIYLPSYARAVLGASPFPAVVAMMLVNVASVFGCVLMGSLIDRLEVTTCFLVSTIGATLGTLVLWGLSVNLPVLYLFCIVYGLFAGSYTSAWPGVMSEITRRNVAGDTSDGSGSDHGKWADPSMVFAFLAMGRGVGNVISGPLSEALVKGMPWKGQAFGGYGSGYGGLIAFTGASALFGGGSYVWKRLGWL